VRVGNKRKRAEKELLTQARTSREEEHEAFRGSKIRILYLEEEKAR